MQVVHYYDEPPNSFSKSIFLAGPSPRTPEVQSWRPKALEIIESRNYDGVVFVPEPKPESREPYDWLRAPEWEHRSLGMSDIILFWIPRDMSLLPNMEPKMPGFTTNFEFGHFVNSGKAVLGSPAKAPHMEYLRLMAKKFHVLSFLNLENTVDKALELVGDGSLRTGGEREIPLIIWRHRAFQNWYQSHKKSGNRLDGAKVQWLSRVRNKPKAIFAFAIQPNIYIKSEGRNKVNDPVLFRLDISSVVLCKREANLLDSEIVLVKEFRSAVSNPDSFVWELPGGSSPYIIDPLEVAIEETREEVGLDLKPERLKYINSRQMAGTFSSHKSHTYFAELTEEEVAFLKSQKGVPHGSDYPENETGERAYTKVLTLREILRHQLVDWSNVGMILSSLGRGNGHLF